MMIKGLTRCTVLWKTVHDRLSDRAKLTKNVTLKFIKFNEFVEDVLWKL